MSGKTMMVVHSEWNEKPTFRMISIDNNCPYNEVIYDLDKKELAIICKESKEKPAMMPKLDSNGRPKYFKGKNEEGELVQAQSSERLIFDSYYEYYIEEESDIRTFVDHFAFNKSHAALMVLNPTAAKKKTTKKEPAKAV